MGFSLICSIINQFVSIIWRTLVEEYVDGTQNSDTSRTFLENSEELIMKASWYVCTLLMKCIVGKSAVNEWTLMEQIHVLKGTTHEEAYSKALKLGHLEEHSYTNIAGELVFWIFVGIGDLEKLLDNSIEDGTEIRSRIFRSGSSDSVVRAKDDLTVFRMEKLKDIVAEEIIVNE